MNAQAVSLLQEIYAIVRDDASAMLHQSLGQYRSVLLREISSRIRTAAGAEVTVPAQVQAIASDEGLMVEIGCFDTDGRMQNLKAISTDEARELIMEIQQSISEVVSREFASLSAEGPTP
jgi:hypothetical protein